MAVLVQANVHKDTTENKSVLYDVIKTKEMEPARRLIIIIVNGDDKRGTGVAIIIMVV